MPLLTKHQLAAQLDRAAATLHIGFGFRYLQAKSWPYCKGGYKLSSIDKHDFTHGGEFTVPVWYVERTDPTAIFAEDRHYIMLRCVDDRNLTESETIEYAQVKEVWRTLCDQAKATLQAAA